MSEAPARPYISGKRSTPKGLNACWRRPRGPSAETNRYPPTNEGITSGRTVITDHILCNGRFVLVVSQARGTDMRTDVRVTVNIRSAVRPKVTRVRGLRSSSHVVSEASSPRIMR